MTGSAKQTKKRQSWPDWIASSLTPLAMTTRRKSALSRHDAPEPSTNHPPGGESVGKAGCPPHRSLACEIKQSTRSVVTTGPSASLGTSTADFLGFESGTEQTLCDFCER